MPVLAMLANVLQAVVLDAAQSAAKEHIMKAINDNLDDKGKELLNKAIENDGKHDKKSIEELL